MLQRWLRHQLAVERSGKLTRRVKFCCQLRYDPASLTQICRRLTAVNDAGLYVSYSDSELPAHMRLRVAVVS